VTRGESLGHMTARSCSRVFCNVIALFCIGITGVHCVESKLVMVSSLSRHGTRAANMVTIPLCPGYVADETVFFGVFGVSPADLTRNGIAAMRQVGSQLRARYLVPQNGSASGNTFMPSSYLEWVQIWSFHAVQKPRHLMSAQSIAQGLFPDHNTPVAVYSRPLDEENELGGPAAICAPETNPYIVSWIRQHAGAWTSTPARAGVVAAVSEACNATMHPARLDTPPGVGNPHPAMDDLCDLFQFATDQGAVLPPSMTPLEVQRCTTMATELMIQRQNSNPKIMMMFVGNFSHNLLLEMSSTLARNKLARYMRASLHDPRWGLEPRMHIKVSSRELLYSLARYYGFDLPVVSGEARGFIEPGATFIWELHLLPHSGTNRSVSAPEGDVQPVDPSRAFVRAFYLSPSTQRAQQLELRGCGRDCPFVQFQAITAYWNARVGVTSWQDLCPTQFCSATARYHSAVAPPGNDGWKIAFLVLCVGVGVAVLGVLAAWRFSSWWWGGAASHKAPVSHVLMASTNSPAGVVKYDSVATTKHSLTILPADTSPN